MKKLTMSSIATYAILTNSAFAVVPPLQEESNELDPIVVSSDFREKKLSQTNNSVSVIGEEELYDRASDNFENVIAQSPNVNFTSGASRAHYIQIRGIGERSQFETPVNPSVGINIDGVDFSQSALGVTMFDVAQIEVLKGPQGTTFGANGMAGVVNIQSNPPTKETEGHIEATVGNYNTKAFGLAIGGSLIENKLLSRVSIYKNSSDGFMKNSYLKREDTNNIDELSTKLQLRWLATDTHTIDLNLLHIDVDNGYDAFTFDNSRTSHADMPGEDKQKTNAISIKSTYQANDRVHLITKVSHSKSDLTYSYDEDWSFVGEFDSSLWPYSYFDEYLRDREQSDFDMRLVSDEDGKIFADSTDWTMGVYCKDSSEDLTRNRTKETILHRFTSKYDTENQAIYAQLDTAIAPKFTLVTGVRLERWEAKYRDSDAVRIDTDENLVGGKIGLEYHQDKNNLHYITLSKGYKPGGVNADNTLIASAKDYQTETLWNLDIGRTSSHLDNRLKSRFNAFYGKRRDQQVKSSVVGKDENGNPTFTDYIANAAKGHYYGIESELDYYPNDSLHLFSNIGLLKAKFDNYTDPNPSSIDMNGREPAQSPSYQFNIGGDIMITDSLIFKANIEGKGAYYFSNRHNEKANSYKLLNSSLEYSNNSWRATLWARNITNEDYQVRGFGSFGNNPANGYATELYTQQGSPRTIGATISYDF